MLSASSILKVRDIACLLVLIKLTSDTSSGISNSSRNRTRSCFKGLCYANALLQPPPEEHNSAAEGVPALSKPRCTGGPGACPDHTLLNSKQEINLRAESRFEANRSRRPSKDFPKCKRAALVYTMPTLYSARAGAPGCRLVGFGHTTWGTSTKCHVSLAITEVMSIGRHQNLRQHLQRGNSEPSKTLIKDT